MQLIGLVGRKNTKPKAFRRCCARELARSQLQSYGLLLAMLALSGCCHLPSARHPAERAPISPAVASRFAYVKAKEFACRETETGSKPEYVVKRIELAGIDCGGCADGTNRSLVIDYYLPRKDETHPVLLVLPMLGGSYPL